MAGGGMAALGVKTERAAQYKGRMTLAVAMNCLVAAVGGAIFGYDIGISVEVWKKMNSTTIALCVASTVIAIAASLTKSVDSLSLERDPCTMCFALALCVAFHGGIALIVRGVRRR
ncbi:uncharacterized protein [Miscanthus floridulus]|uniref:uncharacterized protein n=1 Tax=Miscanthus floridulus TaxID=154761 RepID=UPI00345895CB